MLVSLAISLRGLIFYTLWKNVCVSVSVCVCVCGGGGLLVSADLCKG